MMNLVIQNQGKEVNMNNVKVCTMFVFVKGEQTLAS